MNIKLFSRELIQEIWQVSWTLYKIMIPAIIVIKVLEELGFVQYIGHLFSPFMSVVGLPDSMGLVWATTILINIYAGMILFVQTPEAFDLSVAQVTVLSALMLMAHGLPVEARIAQRVGVQLWVTLLLRIGGGFLFGWLLYLLCSQTGWLQQPNELLWRPPEIAPGLWPWILSQVNSLLFIQVVIAVLIFLLKIIRLIGVEKILGWLLRPILKLLGIGHEAVTITIVGITLGLAFGGGLLIKEVDQGKVSKRDVFAAICLLSLLHSVIEDTLLVLLLGADIIAVLWLRILFSIIVITLMTRLLRNRSDNFWDRYLLNRHIKG